MIKLAHSHAHNRIDALPLSPALIAVAVAAGFIAVVMDFG
jgi:hypothetical protein